MLDVLAVVNGVFLGGIMLSKITLYSDADYDIQLGYEIRDVATVVSTHREWWRDESKCRFVGVMVPYARDWPETIRNGEIETIVPPDPGKVAGQAFILNRKVCPDKADEVILRVAEKWRNPGFLLEKHQLIAEDLASIKPENRPKWLGQVLARINRVAPNDEQIKSFANFTAAARENSVNN